MIERKPIILLSFANDRSDASRYLRKLAQEARSLRAALAEAERDGLCALEVRQGVTGAEILDLFQDARHRDRVAVFHFGGHADGYRLLLETADGSPEAAHAAGLAAFLGGQGGLHLVFLNGCSTRAQAAALLEAGIAAVVATSQAIDDAVATEFAARFYRSLGSGMTIRRAFDEAAAAVRSARGDDLRDLGSTAIGPDGDCSWGDAGCPWELFLRGDAEEPANWSLPEAAGDPLFGLPRPPKQDLPRNPFRYLNWFTEEEAELFFGRGAQIRSILDYLRDESAAPVLLLYGQAGVGKSSLLAAGILPRLLRSCRKAYLRRNQDSDLVEAAQAAVSGQCGWAPREGTGSPLVLILDQVEEIFTRPRTDPRRELEELVRYLRDIFGDRATRPAGKVVLCFRKEWLAEVERGFGDGGPPRAKMFLEPLDRDGIIEVVTGPASAPRLRAHYALQVSERLPDLVAENLLEDPDSAIAPTLQILLSKMWDQVTSKSPRSPCFDEALYQQLKREGLLLGNFLDGQLNALGQWRPAVSESGLVLDVLNYFTTPLGTANERGWDEIRAVYSRKIVVVEALIGKLKDLYLIVDSPMSQSDEGKVRLAHDALAPLVRKRFEESALPGQRARRILENRSSLWKGRKKGTALDEHDLAVAEAGADGMRGWTPDEERLVRSSRRKYFRRYGWGFVLLFFSALTTVAFEGSTSASEMWASIILALITLIGGACLIVRRLRNSARERCVVAQGVATLGLVMLLGFHSEYLTFSESSTWIVRNTFCDLAGFSLIACLILVRSRRARGAQGRFPYATSLIVALSVSISFAVGVRSYYRFQSIQAAIRTIQNTIYPDVMVDRGYIRWRPHNDRLNLLIHKYPAAHLDQAVLDRAIRSRISPDVLGEVIYSGFGEQPIGGGAASEDGLLAIVDATAARAIRDARAYERFYDADASVGVFPAVTFFNGDLAESGGPRRARCEALARDLEQRLIVACTRAARESGSGMRLVSGRDLKEQMDSGGVAMPGQDRLNRETMQAMVNGTEVDLGVFLFLLAGEDDGPGSIDGMRLGVEVWLEAPDGMTLAYSSMAPTLTAAPLSRQIEEAIAIVDKQIIPELTSERAYVRRRPRIDRLDLLIHKYPAAHLDQAVLDRAIRSRIPPDVLGQVTYSGFGEQAIGVDAVSEDGLLAIVDTAAARAIREVCADERFDEMRASVGLFPAITLFDGDLAESGGPRRARCEALARELEQRLIVACTRAARESRSGMRLVSGRDLKDQMDIGGVAIPEPDTLSEEVLLRMIAGAGVNFGVFVGISAREDDGSGTIDGMKLSVNVCLMSVGGMIIVEGDADR